MKSLSCVHLFVTPWTVAYHAPPSVGFPRQEYWSGLPFPSPEDLPDPGIEAGFPPHYRQTLYRLSHQGSPFLTAELLDIELLMTLGRTLGQYFLWPWAKHCNLFKCQFSHLQNEVKKMNLFSRAVTGCVEPFIEEAELLYPLLVHVQLQTIKTMVRAKSLPLC